MADLAAILAEFGARLRKLEGRERGSVFPVVTTLVDITLKAANQTVVSNGASTLTLPLAADARYVEIRVKNIGAAFVDVARGGADTIDGATKITLANQYDAAILWSNGATWYVIASYP